MISSFYRYIPSLYDQLTGTKAARAVGFNAIYVNHQLRIKMREILNDNCTFVYNKHLVMASTETVGQRFVALISHLGISKNAFATSLDKTATVIQHLVEERNKPGFDLLCKVFEVYPYISKDWLLQGVGPMLNTEGAPAPAPAPAVSSTIPLAVEESVAPVSVSPEVAAIPVENTAPAAPVTAPTAVPVSSPVAPAQPQAITEPTLGAAAPTPATTPDTSWQTALYTQQMAHQLALAELRNQHLQEQQRLMQQMMDLMQRQLTR
ncbi:hypothetical protein DNI29_21165 [Hymenobacter sediminis]|uniref:hypothetical protein n=1 Tax=Hymenobacter sediminis TaxID=2218621 RepID=UPI000F505BD9|nr:hypothetical protein [Hymenobacter sediminis]RPD44642.1 hypothetical protein DNI29_21165 [Hymenobacter sediminis]